MTAFADMRARAGLALSGLAPAGDDWPVHDGPVDSVTPPCYVLVWPDVWVSPSTFCSYLAGLDVIVVAARIEPTPGYVDIEAMTAAALDALAGAAYTFAGVTGPAALDVAGLTYLAARIHVSQPIIVPGGQP
jgi:hypothetical protein